MDGISHVLRGVVSILGSGRPLHGNVRRGEVSILGSGRSFMDGISHVLRGEVSIGCMTVAWNIACLWGEDDHCMEYHMF